MPNIVYVNFTKEWRSYYLLICNLNLLFYKLITCQPLCVVVESQSPNNMWTIIKIHCIQMCHCFRPRQSTVLVHLNGRQWVFWRFFLLDSLEMSTSRSESSKRTAQRILAAQYMKLFLRFKFNFFTKTLMHTINHIHFYVIMPQKTCSDDIKHLHGSIVSHESQLI